MRASRLISLVLLLQSRDRMTAAELARELEVSERTVYRDVEALSAAGVPVYAEQGRAGGYRLVAGYRTRLTGLSREEAEALFLSGLPGPAGDMGLADAVAAAELKVLAALPGPLRDAPARAGQRFHLDAPGWFHAPAPPPLLRGLAAAVWSDAEVELRYRRKDGEVTRTADPYGLVLKNGTWYLVALVDGRGRTYRVDRIAAVAPTGATFDRDVDFDLAEYWREQADAFARSMLHEEITVRLGPEGMRRLRFAATEHAVRRAVEAAGEPDADGWRTTVLPVESLDVAATEMRILGADVEVLGPPELRARMAETAARLAALYARPGGGGGRGDGGTCDGGSKDGADDGADDGTRVSGSR
ncbi:helix-turn-helix transcriptional regulator [Actinomadura sp. WAC 06369]|uniref:helix-turn-helix transcriptional regulator n=1 Tax=Actinomadura sp. WAC 06369 TaxID=2203193 RepID=UPI000F7829A3|nr:YafY family protein [Actinomadura sp. WAC 06369]RSN68689.1 transcriptional regulator [Actinomadura sp. WAC 06369]